ncbi:hypothetical protein Tco_1505858 [Tanacetum coccineum]
MSQPANDEFSQHLSDDEESNHENASDTGDAPKQQQHVIPQTTVISNIKLPILKKEEYDIWAMEMVHYLEKGKARLSLTDGHSQGAYEKIIARSNGSNLAMTMEKLTRGGHFIYDDCKASLIIVKSGLIGAYNTCTPSSSSPIFLKRKFLLRIWDFLHEDLEQIDDVDIEEMDINWQISIIAIRMKKFYKKTGRRVRVDGKTPVGFDKKKD